MFPMRRMRRGRRDILRPMLTETYPETRRLIAPLFVDESAQSPVPVQSMPGIFRYPVHGVVEEARRIHGLGIPAVIIFGIPSEKDAEASQAFDPAGVVQEAVRSIKQAIPGLVVITDLCACEYTTHGHCGVIGMTRDGPGLLNDPSLMLMNRIAVSHAQAGADIVAPSCMLDGMVGSIRKALDGEGYTDVLILSYAVKFASALYGPFRDAACSGYSFGDRKGYQMNPANRREALVEAELDVEEGTDILMVKPAGWYLDIISDISRLGLPVAAYQVSGEYAMVMAAAENGWIDLRSTVLESLVAIRRAGADLIITYFAAQAAEWIHEEP